MDDFTKHTYFVNDHNLDLRCTPLWDQYALAATVEKIRQVQRKFDQYFDRNVAVKGFWVNDPGSHSGTHENEYFDRMHEVWKRVADRENAAEAMSILWTEIERGDFW